MWTENVDRPGRLRAGAASRWVAGGVGIVLAASLAGLTGCGAEATSPDVLATSDLGEVTRLDLEEHILALPEDQRKPADGQEPTEWRRGKLEQLLLARYLEQEARSREVLEAAEAQELIAAQTDALLKQEVEARRVRERVSVTGKELQEYYDTHPEEFSRGERVRVRHIFRRVPPDATDAERQAIRDETAELLAQLRSGANFQELAKAHSDSETANLGGLIGRVNRGTFSERQEEIIWSLDEGEISEIVSTPVGFHIFKVDDHLPPETRELGEVRGVLTRRLTNLQSAAALSEYFDELLDASEALYAPDGLTAEDESTLLFELQDERLTLGEWRERFAGRPFLAQRTRSEREQLEAWVRGRLYLWEAERLGLADEPAVTEKLERLKRNTAATLALQEARMAVLDSMGEADLREHYEANVKRFQTPRLVRMRLVTMSPSNETGRSLNAIYEQLHGIAKQIRAGRIDFADAAQRWSEDPSAAAGGDVGGVRLDRFAAWAGPLAQKAVAQLVVGNVSDPILIESYDQAQLRYDRAGYMLVLVEDIQEPQVQPFDDVRDQVVQQLAQQRAAEISDQLTAEAFAAIHVRVFEQNL